jgi:hypothetical protein
MFQFVLLPKHNFNKVPLNNEQFKVIRFVKEFLVSLEIERSSHHKILAMHSLLVRFLPKTYVTKTYFNITLPFKPISPNVSLPITFSNKNILFVVRLMSNHTDDGGSKLLWNVTQYLQDYTV